MAIDYKLVGWDTSKFVNPTNMNQMDNGIKAACDGVDALNVEMDAVDENLATKNLKTYTNYSQLGLETVGALEDIMTALPPNSVIEYGVSAGSNTSILLPLKGQPGELKLVKRSSSNGGRGYAECRRQNSNSNMIWVNMFFNGSFLGWGKFITDSDLEEITSNDAIAKSAVYNYIKSDGSLGNIEYDLSQLASRISALENK